MPFNHEALGRRRILLNISQNDLAIMAGVNVSSVSRIERGLAPNGGSNIGIDVAMRLAEALQMELRDLLIAPQGNRYERAVQYAHAQHSGTARAKLFDEGRSVRARAMRKMTRPTRTVHTGENGPLVADPPALEFELTPQAAAELLARRRAERAGTIAVEPAHEEFVEKSEEDGWVFADPSTE